MNLEEPRHYVWSRRHFRNVAASSQLDFYNARETYDEDREIS